MNQPRILIIDDDITSLDIIDLLFEKNGYEVLRAVDGPTALNMLENERLDVILIDLLMPEMNGQECVRRLRARGVTIPVIAFTAVDDEEIHREALNAGCTKVLTKPCKPITLLQTVTDLLKH